MEIHNGTKVFTRKETEKRFREILSMRGKGKTFTEIGLKYDVSRVRAHQLYRRALVWQSKEGK